MTRLAARLDKLDHAAGNSATYLHAPADGDDHAAAWAQSHSRGGTTYVCHWPGLNDDAVAAYWAAGAKEGNDGSAI